MAVFLAPPREGAGRELRRIWNFVLIGLTIATGLYVVIRYPVLQRNIGQLSADRVVLGTIAVALVLEATRRVAGWPLVIVTLALIFYCAFSGYFPGLLNAPSNGWDQIAAYLYLDTNSLFGVALDVTATTIIPFILFGRILFLVKGDQVLTDFAMIAMGQYRGGPAKVAVLASSLFGTASGSAVSNVVMNGPLTIPLMRKNGYPAHMAAAIEAVASTGGQIMPPVMGITAFIIAEYLRIPYRDVIIAAIAPAGLYYLALFLQIDLEAARRGLKGTPRSELPPLQPLLRKGAAFVVPILVLLWLILGEHWQPGRAAIGACGAALLVGMLRAETRPDWRGLVVALRDTGDTVYGLVVITAIAGLVIGCLQLSGLAFSFSMILLSVSKGSMFFLLLITAAVCIVLGMGLPTAVIYMMLAILVAPALIDLGAVPITAHLFLFYFGILSMITPPICLATFAAARIARPISGKPAGRESGSAAPPISFPSL